MTKQALTATDSPVYQLADSLTNEQLEIELAAATGTYADTVRKALGRRTQRALTTTQYGAKLAVARKILNRKARASKPTIEASVKSLGPFHANPSNLKEMGWSKREIEAAVRRGTLAWTRDGGLEVV